MAELVFATEMKGQLEPVAGKESTFTFHGSGQGPKGERVTTRSEVVMTGEGFKEAGTIEYNGRGKVSFETRGIVYLEPSPIPDLQCGAVLWYITGGEGEFQGASGYITSNFTLSANGEIMDNNYARIFVP